MKGHTEGLARRPEGESQTTDSTDFNVPLK